MKRRHHRSGRRREIPPEIVQDIMLKLPTKDVVRSSCVSKLWYRILKDPTFGKLHAAADRPLAPSESEALLVSVTREPGRRDEASFFNLSSGKAMCQSVAIPKPGGYSLANICNGFLCFVLDDYEYDQAPVVVCNPVTGETFELPKAPRISVSEENDGGHVTVTHLWHHRFVLGFSPPTQEYKMFRLSFPQYYSREQETNYITVYTLGSCRGWRQYSYTSQFRPLHIFPPKVHIDGNLYILVENGRASAGRERAARMLILNVATETRCVYRLPYNSYHHNSGSSEMIAYAFELNGQMCLAVNVSERCGCYQEPERKLKFWVMKPPAELGGKDDDDELHWDLRYCFNLGESFTFRHPMGAWLDHKKMLCFRSGNFLYKYDTKGYSLSSNDGLVLFNQKLELPEAPSTPPDASPSHSAWLPSWQWNIYGGYRPSLLSPLTFALPPSSQDEKGKKRLFEAFEHTLLRAVRQTSKKSH